jgi:rhodanese-related sulfurtransferase
MNQVPEVDPETARLRQVEEGAMVLDVRELEELVQVRVPDATHIPLGELQNRLSELPSDKEIYVLCHVGQRSAMGTAILQQSGFRQVWNVSGGIVGWLRSGLPAEWGKTS